MSECLLMVDRSSGYGTLGTVRADDLSRLRVNCWGQVIQPISKVINSWEFGFAVQIHAFVMDLLAVLTQHLTSITPFARGNQSLSGIQNPKPSFSTLV